MNTKRIRILQLLPECHDRANDPEDLAEQIIAAFPRADYELASLYLQGRPAAGQPPGRAERTYYFDLPDAALKGLRIPLKRALRVFFAREEFDVVICHRHKSVSAMLSVNRRVGVPLCIGVAHGFGEYSRFWRKLHARLRIDSAWRFVGVSDAVRDHLIAQRCGFTRDNTVSIPNAFDVAATEQRLLARDTARKELGLPQEARIVGAIGRLVPIKGHIHLIRAFSRIAPHFPQAHLAIIGDGREAPCLQAEIDQHGLGERIHLLGWRSRAKQYVRAFDIWTMPSLKEGFGLALLEGMCGHLPVIGSDIPAMRPMILGAGGQCIPPANVDALADALSTYLNLPDTRLTELGEIAYRYVEAHHSIEDYRAAYFALVTQALKEPRTRRRAPANW